MPGRRLRQEVKTVTIMIHMYCRRHHGVTDKYDFCRKCYDLKKYAEKRLTHCPFGNAKPVCSRCTVHCYNPGRRQQIKIVMRYAGPRMMYTHPVMAVRHLWHSIISNYRGSYE